MLDLQKINSGKMETAHDPSRWRSCWTASTPCIGRCWKEKGLTFSLEGAGQFDTAYIGDGVKVKQILMNLLSNAMKFTAAGGCVAVSAARAPLDQGTDEVQFTVTDTGIGMSEEFQTADLPALRAGKVQFHLGLCRHGTGTEHREKPHGAAGRDRERDQQGGGEGSSFYVRLPLKRGNAAGACD
jgi:light-regulated signal transduction histidine kinase (bacteriophytochrome)